MIDKRPRLIARCADVADVISTTGVGGLTLGGTCAKLAALQFLS